MFTGRKVRFSTFRSAVSILAVALSAGWLYLASLGCLAEEILDGMAVFLNPHRLTLAPNTTVKSTGSVKWGSESVGPSSWAVDASGIEAIQSLTVSPKIGYETTISVTGGSYDAIYDESRFSFSSFSEYTIPVSATFDQPVASAALGAGVPVTRQKYLALQAANPHMELTVPALAPILHPESGLLEGKSSVRGLILGAKAEVKNAPGNWKYKFSFSLRVEAQAGGGGMTTVFLRGNEIPVTEDPNGKWATIKFNNLNLGMDHRFNDNLWGFNAVMGVYFIYLYVDVEQVNGGIQKYWTQEFMRYPFYINSR